MTEYAAQALVYDRENRLDQATLLERAREELRATLLAKGAASVRFDTERHLRSQHVPCCISADGRPHTIVIAYGDTDD